MKLKSFWTVIRMGKSISIDDMADAIMEGLQDYAELAESEMKKAVRKTATAVKKEIQETAPVKSGRYKKSWRSKKTTEKSNAVEYTVYSIDRYQLAHLLEKGHALRNGGRADGTPHIAPAEEHGAELLEDLITEALS